MTWQGHARRDQLPPEWKRHIVPRIKKRDQGVCQWRDEHGDICGQVGTDVDHKVRGSDHSDENLQLLCHWHHLRKTSKEGAAARGPALTERRPPERHPGLL